MDSWPHKDPDETADYQFDWSARLETGETIASSEFILESGDVVLGDKDVVDAVTTIWLSGGTVGTISVITNRVTTSNVPPRIWDKSAKLRIRSK